ncbi:NAD-dependent epimerase/dehydratase family protein [Sphingobium phenoxybenzoativorans]|uniref:NAD-dependent epimerase/dehydratase family protein n=1 Tax=Sphingobium phenoxybenzoativorans TaxID=1592790 RepID=UPI0008732B38|nr:NAD-dependent epimerase/dehydratase family protein [Sphingobium phenoxybenzoativorans]
MKKNLLITGGAGFIGSHLTNFAREAGHSVRILDNLSPQIHGADAVFHAPEGVEFVRGDITSRDNIEACLEGIDTIVHLAAETGTGQSMYQIQHYYDVNVQGTALLFDILANQPHGVSKVILASSRSVYGEGAYLCHNCDTEGARRFPSPRSPKQLAAHVWEPVCPVCNGPVSATATREDDGLAPASIYAASKLAQEDLVKVGCTALGMGYAILRFQNVFGEGQSLNNPYTGILSIFSTRIRLGLPLPIFEDGAETRDFVHVEDVAKAVLRSAEQESFVSGTMNVGMGNPTPIMEVARLLCQSMDSPIEPHVTAQYRVGDIRHNYADIGNLEKNLLFTPAISLEAGLKRFCEWVASQPIPQDYLDKANAELKERNLMG